MNKYKQIQSKTAKIIKKKSYFYRISIKTITKKQRKKLFIICYKIINNQLLLSLFIYFIFINYYYICIEEINKKKINENING